ncbi:hypothetical protein EVG20_g10690 [Dentipellis fragilis]|uniref:Uncharacterized protein n=1 Tax=Dentipellis fragilis TaxID=205917 RepID=A0A4Y9XRX3_9AGAM|nr:hypothetical protein EVG20_g10690 [Dentipellis fragilis]
MLPMHVRHKSSWRLHRHPHLVARTSHRRTFAIAPSAPFPFALHRRHPARNALARALLPVPSAPSISVPVLPAALSTSARCTPFFTHSVPVPHALTLYYVLTTHVVPTSPGPTRPFVHAVCYPSPNTHALPPPALASASMWLRTHTLSHACLHLSHASARCHPSAPACTTVLLHSRATAHSHALSHTRICRHVPPHPRAPASHACMPAPPSRP